MREMSWVEEYNGELSGYIHSGFFSHVLCPRTSLVTQRLLDIPASE